MGEEAFEKARKENSQSFCLMSSLWNVVNNMNGHLKTTVVVLQ